VIVSAHDGYPRHVNSGADFIELDIRRTPEGVIVLAHDPIKPGKRYVTFDEVLARTPSNIGLHLDLKERGFELELMERALTHPVVLTPDFAESVDIIKRHHPHVRVSPIDFVAVDQANANEQTLNVGRPVWVWTVDDKRLMERFMNDRRVEAIITNRPGLALRLRSARS
jgi:glycerophosphoryl diester phosphodiesterase